MRIPPCRPGCRSITKAAFTRACATSLKGSTVRLRNPAFATSARRDRLYGASGASSAAAGRVRRLLYYVFAGGDGATDYAEPYASLSYLIGPAFFTAGAKYAPSQAGTGHEDMLYLYGSVDVTIPFRPWSFRLEAGRQDWGAFGAYWTWSLGGRYHVQLEGLPNTEIGLRYVTAFAVRLQGGGGCASVRSASDDLSPGAGRVSGQEGSACLY